MSSNKMATKSDLQEMYSRILPYLGGSADAGFTPIGTIIAVFSETAPANYLICDGATYNKADYPELAAHLLALATHSQYEVSGDSTKFKVPDLRGEFLRGTGTNGHSGEGSGANVGVHQAATLAANGILVDNSSGAYHLPMSATTNWTNTVYSDSEKKSLGGVVYGNALGNIDRNNNVDIAQYTSRPTNTSVLFCIATKNIYLNPENDYSTDEKVIGTWIDGATVYQRTVTVPENVVMSNSNANISLGVAVPNIKDFINYKMHQYNGTNYYNPPLLRLNYENVNFNLVVFDNIYWGGNGFTIQAGTKITIQYTKTS